MNNDRFQGLCLINNYGYKYMCSEYDRLPEPVRDRLKSSSYNLCAACIASETFKKAFKKGPKYGRITPTIPEYLSVISDMEAELRTEELIGETT